VGVEKVATMDILWKTAILKILIAYFVRFLLVKICPKTERWQKS